MITIFTLDGRKPCSTLSGFRPAPSAGCVVLSPPPPLFEGGAVREEPPLVEQPRRILSGKIDLFGSGQIGP